MSRWMAGAGVLVAGLIGLVATDARASVSIAATFDGLLHASTAAVVVTPFEARPVWEGGRIYTYSHVHVERALAGELSAGSDAWVRTMGGVVGSVGQIVDGEAVLARGSSSLVFLHGGPVGAYDVTARGQGQYPIAPATDTKTPAHVMPNHAVGGIVQPRLAQGQTPPPLAADVIQGRAVDDIAKDVAAAWSRTHGG